MEALLIENFLVTLAAVVTALFFFRVAFPRERRHLGGGNWAPLRNQDYDYFRRVRSGRVETEMITTEKDLLVEDELQRLRRP